MNQDVMPAIVRMDAETLRKLTTEVKETIASGYSIPKGKNGFHSVDLWNINRNWKMTSRISRKWGI